MSFMIGAGMSRKDFLKKSGLGVISWQTAGALEGVAESQATKKLVINNARLETGFRYEEGEVIGTNTELFTITVANGVIETVEKKPSNDPTAIDAKGKLVLPAFRDMHIHLDKTFYGGPWQATRPRKNGVKGMIALEQKILPELLKTSTERAEKMIELLQSKGSSFARSHVNIEPTSKMQSLTNLQQALANKKAGFSAELVAFPQHGVFYTDSVPYMKEAAKMDIDFIGGLDPYSIDGAIERTIDFTVQLALDYNKGIDIHLHETGESGLATVEYLIKKVLENTTLKNKTFLSHCFVLAKLDPVKQESVAADLAEAGIGIASTIPFGNLIMPIPLLYKHGVNVVTGNDSIVDHWNSWGTGSVLQKANTMAQLYGYSTELPLSRCLRLATGDVLPLNETGVQQWPIAGDVANFVLVNASCSAEAVARVAEVRALVHEGRLVYQFA